MTTAKPESKSPQYGYGFGIEEGGKAVGHSGGFPGISSNLLIFLYSGYTLAVMSNVDAGAVEVSDLVRSMLRARQQKQEPSATFDQAAPPPK